MSWQTAILAALVSAAVAVILGPLRAGLEEAGRQRYAERRKLVRLLQAFRFRLKEEERRCRRIAAGTGSVPRGDPPRIWDFEAWARNVLEFDSVSVGGWVARKMREHLCSLMGTWRVEYLETLGEAPANPTSVRQMGDRMIDSEAIQHNLNSPVDRFVQDQSHDPNLVVPIIQRVDKMLSVCNRLWP